MSFAAVALGDIAEINPSAPKLAPDDEVSFLPMAGAQDDGTVAISEFRSYREVKTGYTGFANDDVLIAKVTPCFENNKIVQASLPTAFGFGSTEFHVARAGDDLDARYLLHFLRQDWVRYAGERRMTGSGGQRRVPKQFLEQLPIAKPPLPEQRRIAAILDQAFALRRLRRQSLSRLSDLGQAIFFEMFGDPILNSKQLPTNKLGQIGTLDRGKSPHRPRNDPALLGGRYPLIQTGDVARSHDFIRSFTSTYSEIGLRQSKLWKRGTLCITIAANIADTAILDFDACFPDSVVGFDAGSASVNFFVHSWLKITRGELERVAPAVAQKNINLAILRDLDIIAPSNHQVEEYYRRMQSIFWQRGTLEVQEAGLDRAFASLQHRAFRGEL